MESIKVKIKTLSKMIEEFGSDHLGVLTTPPFNIFMESWIPKDRIMNVLECKQQGTYLIGTYLGHPYYISNESIEQFL